MNPENFNPDDRRLTALMREARATPSLPPRFQAGVWRRIESADESSVAATDRHWLNVIVGWLVRPRLAFAVAAVLVLAGVGLGWRQGEHLARHDAQARYLAAVAPNSLR